MAHRRSVNDSLGRKKPISGWRSQISTSIPINFLDFVRKLICMNGDILLELQMSDAVRTRTLHCNIKRHNTLRLPSSSWIWLCFASGNSVRNVGDTEYEEFKYNMRSSQKLDDYPSRKLLEIWLDTQQWWKNRDLLCLFYYEKRHSKVTTRTF